MKKLVVALASAALLLAACTPETGKPYDELPPVQQDALWSFFAALPNADVPGAISPSEDRKAYRSKFEGLKEGVLGDGEGPEDETKTNSNTIYWSDYFSLPDDYDWSQVPEDALHPYANFHVYPGVGEGKLFGILESGAYSNGDNKKEPVRAYWYDTTTGKVKPGTIVAEPEYNADNITPDALLVYGCDDLHFSLKDGKFGPSYYDRGFSVYIDEVGMSGVEYEWDGVQFNRIENPVQRCIYNYGFAHLFLGEDEVPWSVPGYVTELVNEDNPFDRIYKITADGEDEPTLILHATDESIITEIIVCSPRYANPYGIHPGSPYSDLLKVREKFNDIFGEDTAIAASEQPDGFVYVYAGFDADFCYMIPRSDWLGGESFKGDAVISRIAIVNGAG